MYGATTDPNRLSMAPVPTAIFRTGVGNISTVYKNNRPKKAVLKNFPMSANTAMTQVSSEKNYYIKLSPYVFYDLCILS